MRAWIVIVIAACGAPQMAPKQRSADASVDAMPDATPDAAETAAAVPEDYGEERWKHATLDELDTTVTIDDVKQTKGAWPTRKKIRANGRVMLALESDRWVGAQDGKTGVLRLVVIANGDGDRSSYELGAVKPETFAHSFDGDTYLSAQGPTEEGPLLFAVRTIGPDGAPDGGERRQVAIYVEGASVRVVEKMLSETAWKPRLKIDFVGATSFVGIETTDPH
ncbi:MAG TPA: hypothetical protein VL463_32850 [Kofleriaceae bacterium]|nr:hypothetical protein [Kofleriaceae bacterium]